MPVDAEVPDPKDDPNDIRLIYPCRMCGAPKGVWCLTCRWEDVRDYIPRSQWHRYVRHEPHIERGT